MINPATLTPMRQMALWGFNASYNRDLHVWHITFTDSGWCIGTATTAEAARDWLAMHNLVTGEWPVVGPVACPICNIEEGAPS